MFRVAREPVRMHAQINTHFCMESNDLFIAFNPHIKNV